MHCMPIAEKSSDRLAHARAWGTLTTRFGSIDLRHFCSAVGCIVLIVATDAQLHRLAYNGAFEAFDLKVNGDPVVWDVAYYDILQNTVGGGKPKMKWHFTNTAKAWPTSTMGAAPDGDEAAQNALVDALQDKKTEIYKKIVQEVAEARPGVLPLMDQVPI